MWRNWKTVLETSLEKNGPTSKVIWWFFHRCWWLCQYLPNYISYWKSRKHTKSRLQSTLKITLYSLRIFVMKVPLGTQMNSCTSFLPLYIPFFIFCSRSDSNSPLKAAHNFSRLFFKDYARETSERCVILILVNNFSDMFLALGSFFPQKRKRGLVWNSIPALNHLHVRDL